MNFGPRWQSLGPLLCYLLLASIYLVYWPHAEFVLDDWFLFQKFEQARANGAEAQWELAGVLARSQLWGTFRIHWLSLFSVFGLYQLAGPHPGFYFVFGILLHAAVAFLLYRTLVRLEIDSGAALLAGAVFVLLPTARNPLLWFPSCGQYVLAALWFLVYLRSVAGTVAAGRLLPRAALLQSLALAAALFSTDQAVGLVLLGALWLAVCWRSRAALAAALAGWTSVGVAGGLYLLLVRSPVTSSVAERFAFAPGRLAEILRATWLDYRNLAGFGGGYYSLATIGWGVVVALAAGLVVFWRLADREPGRSGLARAALLGAGLWVLGSAPVCFLNWRSLRYDYLPSLGLAMALAAACFALLRRWPARLLPAGGALLVAWCAATAFAEIQQCWKPQAQNLAAIKRRLRELKVNYHDTVVISNVPMQIGAIEHFAMVNSYVSRPFVETVTGVWGVVVGRDIYCESGHLGLQHADFMHPLKREDLARTHVVVSGSVTEASPRTLLACETGPGRYELYPLKGHIGPPPAPRRVYSQEELRSFEKVVYFARRHH